MSQRLDRLDPVDSVDARLGALEATRRVHQETNLFPGPCLGQAVIGMWSNDTTNASFTSIWEAFCPTVPYPGLYVRLNGNDGGVNSGEWRIKATVDEGVFYSPVTASSSTPGSTWRRRIKWLHGWDLYRGGVHLEAQARRTAGAGGIGTYRPLFIFVDPVGCQSVPTWVALP